MAASLNCSIKRAGYGKVVWDKDAYVHVNALVEFACELAARDKDVRVNLMLA